MGQSALIPISSLVTSAPWREDKEEVRSAEDFLMETALTVLTLRPEAAVLHLLGAHLGEEALVDARRVVHAMRAKTLLWNKGAREVRRQVE